MVTRQKTLKSDNTSVESPKRDTQRELFDALRTARLNRGLSQQELAGKLGLHQRQISDLERASMDPRLSTVQNVARALDLELLLVPRHLIPAIEGLQRVGTESTKRPMYALSNDDDDDEADPDSQSVTELGGDPAPEDQQTRRRPKERR
jgi:transcriptional regulator with XRE-family HTH domain